MFGDNQSVVTNATVPHSQLNKRHNALSYHRVREAMACKDLLGFYHIKGDTNPADILSKHWGFRQVWPMLKSLLFWSGETKDIPDGVATKTNMHVQARGEYYDSGLVPSSVRHLASLARENPKLRDVSYLEFPELD